MNKEKRFCFFTIIAMLILAVGMMNPVLAEAKTNSKKMMKKETTSSQLESESVQQKVTLSPIALNNQATMYYKGKGVKQDYSKALYLYKKAAEQGHMASAITVGYMYENALGTSLNYMEAMQWYRKAADKEYASAQKAIGDLYLLGKGVSRDSKMAAQWYQKAANQNFIDAQCILGYLYIRGHGVQKDLLKGRELLEEGTKQNNACAQHYLAFMYMNGLITALPNTEKAIELDQMAARNGNAEAQYNIGKANEIGWITYATELDALNWYIHSANQGYPLAMERLAEVYEKGQLKQKIDSEKAVLWRKKASAAWNNWFEPRPVSLDQVRFMPEK